ncbi:ATP-binding protein [Halarcobacter anaerophilus]|uniref:ATP-binding protein n=1 Tax=Halarcobacter anaerophilus TaxID=877500 RepID=UPI0005C97B7A|nr:ATP-binding protein [Halarcobacter anaerophilus]
MSKCLKERVEYFSTIATAQGREIKLQINSKCIVKMDKKELIRLIDNNLSNAIKYSKLHSLIEVTLENNILNFTSQGDKIVDKKAIFDKYKRENSSIGGHGLGLSIVKDITQNII